MAKQNNEQAAANVAAATTQALQTRTTVPATMAGMKSASVANVFGLYKDQIQRAIPKHLTAERVIQLATTMVSRTPDLAQCTSESLIGAVMQASILGFEPVNQLGLVYFVPRYNKNIGKKEVVFQLGYKGKIDLVRRSNELQTIYAQCVYEHDLFEYEFGLDPKLVHKPAVGDQGAFIAAYAVAKFKSGGYAFDVMRKTAIDKIRKRSATPESGPWVTDYEAMAQKTVIHRLSKLLPMSVDTMRNVAVDNAVVNLDSFTEGGEVDLGKIEYAEASVLPNESAQPDPMQPTDQEKLL